MFIPYYDEFLIYTTQEEILNFINENKNINNKEDIIKLTIEKFGEDLSSQIEYIVNEQVC